LPINSYKTATAEAVKGLRHKKQGYDLILIDGTDPVAFENTLRHEL
jgi:spermidine synthase